MQASQSRSHNKASYFATVPTQEIVPVTNDRHESSISGIFVIGDATGTPLVKVAAQHGRDAVQYLTKSGDVSESGDRPLGVVIIGGGPGGIAAAVEAKRQGFRYVLLERGRLASTIAGFPPGKMVYSEPRGLADSSAIGFDADEDRDAFLDRLDRLVTEEGLMIKQQTSVERIERRQDGVFEVVCAGSKRFPTRQVIIAIGRQGEPRPLGCIGAETEGRVVYQLRSPNDYVDRDVLVVGGGNSAIESALMLMDHNRVTLSYRGGEFYRAKEENRCQLEAAIQSGKLQVLTSSQVTEIRDHDVDLKVGDATETLRNDIVIAQLGTLPPIDFYLHSDLELDGIWTKKRVFYALIGLLVGVFIYFGAKHFALHSDAAGSGKWLVPGAGVLAGIVPWGALAAICQWFLPLILLPMLAIDLIASGMRSKGKRPILEIPHGRVILWSGALAYIASYVLPSTVTLDPAQAGPGPYYVPGFAWMYRLLPTYFGNAYGLYYLAYFSAIAGFGIYWAAKSGHALIWRRNLTIIATQWTLWWGIPTFLAVFLGRNPWTPVITKSLNAWPLNLAAFKVDPAVGPGDPAWWHTVAVVGVVWAAFLTFVVIPVMTIRWGKIYCSYICSCGALAETVGNGYRHRGPKGDIPRRFERYGFVFVALAAAVTIADLYGYTGPLEQYNLWVGTGLAGAVAIGLYPFLGQRVWCRMWCPLAFWMNFWGRWSQFKITPEPGKCIDCNVCNQYPWFKLTVLSIPPTVRATSAIQSGIQASRRAARITIQGDRPGGIADLDAVDSLPGEWSIWIPRPKVTRMGIMCCRQVFRMCDVTQKCRPAADRISNERKHHASLRNPIMATGTEHGITSPEALESIAVIIPALNEERSLPLVLRDLPSVGQVIVVDNGSTDDTASVAAACGATVVSETKRGYGAACLKGLEALRESCGRSGTPPQVIVFLDADYSDHPEFLPALVSPIQDGEYDFVLGSRLLGKREPGAMPPQSVYGNRLACFLMRVLFRIRYTDLGPFRAVDYRKLQQLRMEDQNFGWTIEMQIKAAKNDLRFLEVPVPYRKRVGHSKISGTLTGTIKAGYKILWTIAKYGLFAKTPIRGVPATKLVRATHLGNG